MYQAKSLGKNQISGNPRPRRLATQVVAEEPAAAPPDEEPQPAAEAPAAAAFTVEARSPSGVDPMVAAAGAATAPAAAEVDSGDGRVPGGVPPEAAGEEEEPDPSEVRRQIAAARLNMDPDHQIRRAMDAFLSSSPRSTPEGD
jgi:hypothetical protein